MAHLATQWLSSLNHLLSRLIRKVWTESEKNHEAGGIYLFSDEKSALTYLEKHTARLKNLGVEEVVAKVFDVNVPLSQINQAKLA